ncbi:MAG: ECF transporter S component [Chloroflexi bacterium]|nr:ECF transporter S component [Chloroflexota bacterium]
MSSMSIQRSAWGVDSRVIVYAAIGAALYGVVALFSFVIPGSNNVSVRPAFAIVPFFGYAFGPVVGLFTGLVGNAIVDQLSGYGLLTAWNWHIANGLVGLIAGVLAAGSMARMGGKIVGPAIVAAISIVIGMLFVFSDIFVFGNDFNTALTGSYLWVLVPDLIAGVILVPLLVMAWEPLKESLGR